jgi:hypothetical protein
MLLNTNGNPICQFVHERGGESKKAARIMTVCGEDDEENELRGLAIDILNNRQIYLCPGQNRSKENKFVLPAQHDLELSYVGANYKQTMFAPRADAKKLFRKVIPMSETIIWRVNNQVLLRD